MRSLHTTLPIANAIIYLRRPITGRANNLRGLNIMRKLNQTTTKTATKQAAKTAKPGKLAKLEAKAEKPARKAAIVAVHEIAPSYAGPSTGFNASRSRSTLRLDIGSGAFTYRDDSSLRDLIAKYAGKAFARLNVDAGIIRRLASAGVLTVSDNGSTLTVSPRGVAYAAGSKPLNAGDKIPLSTVAEIASRKAGKQAAKQA